MDVSAVETGELRDLSIAWGLIRGARAAVAETLDEFTLAELVDLDAMFSVVRGLEPAPLLAPLEPSESLARAEAHLRAAMRVVPLALWATFRCVRQSLG